MSFYRLLLVVAIGCGPTATSTAIPAAPAKKSDVPMSDPAEYAIDRVTREAGRLIFERTGIGDPYATGVPYPIFLALLESYPGHFGSNTDELAAKFGFIARAADAKSDDADVRA